MAIKAEVEGVGTLEFPDGTDPAVIQQTVSRVVEERASRAGRLQALYPGGNVPPERNAISSALHGPLDTVGGAAQWLTRGLNAAGVLPQSTGNSFLAGPQEVDQQNAAGHEAIDRKFGKPAPGFDLVRSATAAATALPLGPTKYLQAPTWLGRAAGAGVSGAVAGGVQDIPNPGDDFWMKKGAQIGMGFAGGAIAQPIAEQTIKFVVAGMNKLADKGVATAKNLSGANDMNTIVGLTREALKRSGIDYDALSETTRRGMMDDVQKALGGYSGLNQGAVARQSAFREAGFDPLRHWITRDPAEFTTLSNLSHQPAGDPLKQRLADLDKFALDRLNAMRGNQPSPVDIGKAGTRDLQGYLGAERGKTNVLYDTFREIAPDVKGDPQRFVNDLFNNLEGKFASASLPAGLREIVNGVSEGKIPLTPSTLYQLQKMASAASQSSDGSTRYAAGHLVKAIEREMEAISGSIKNMDRSLPVPAGTPVPPKQGQYAADVLQLARGQHSKISGEVEGSRMLTAADNGVAPDNFVAKLMGSPRDELASTWGKLSPDTRSQVRSQVLDELKRTVYGGASDDAGKAAAQASFAREMSDPAFQEKLRIVLGDSKFQELKRLSLMLESAHLQPSGSAVNNSKTGGMLLGAFSKGAEAMKAKNLWGGSFLQDSSQRGLAQAAQSIPAGTLGSQSLVINPLIEELLKRRIGYGAGLLSGVSAYPAFQDRVK